MANYHVCNGRMQNSLLSSLLCSAIDGFKLWIHQWHYIKEKKVMNSAYGHYGPDSLLVLYHASFKIIIGNVFCLAIFLDFRIVWVSCCCWETFAKKEPCWKSDKLPIFTGFTASWKLIATHVRACFAWHHLY